MKDYIGADGLLRCGACGGKRQTQIDVFGVKKIVPCICACDEAARQRRQEAMTAAVNKAREAAERREAWSRSDIEKMTFEQDDGREAWLMRALKAYCRYFPDALKEGRGLLLYGGVGVGKTFGAACVVNQLEKQGYKCIATSFTRLLNTIGEHMDDRQTYLDGLKRYDMLLLDDYGTERRTEYAYEQIFEVVDARRRAGKPMIITTNLTREQLTHPQSVQEQRLIERILEKCYPLEVKGANRRREGIRENNEKMTKIIKEA